MANFKELLPKINSFVFDIDGVLSDGSIIVTENGGQRIGEEWEWYPEAKNYEH